MLSLLVALLLILVPQKAFAQTDLDPCSAGGGGVACVTSNLEFGSVVGGVVNMIFIIAVVAALGFLVWGGFKWLTSGGDKEGVESARNTIIAAIVGLIIIFLSYVVLNLLLVFLGYPGGISDITITPLTSGL